MKEIKQIKDEVLDGARINGFQKPFSFEQIIMWVEYVFSFGVILYLSAFTFQSKSSNTKLVLIIMLLIIYLLKMAVAYFAY